MLCFVVVDICKLMFLMKATTYSKFQFLLSNEISLEIFTNIMEHRPILLCVTQEQLSDDISDLNL